LGIYFQRLEPFEFLQEEKEEDARVVATTN
jgi:hypothetical protein